MKDILKSRLQQLAREHFKQNSELDVAITMSLDDISLSNIHFANVMQEFAPTEHGYSANISELATLNSQQLYILKSFLHFVQLQCPSCFDTHVQAGMKAIDIVSNQQLLVS